VADYTKTTNFTAKDALNTGDPAKIIQGAALDTEFTAIATAVASKANAASPTLTGTGTAVNLTMSGTLSTNTIAETTADTGVTVDGVLLKDGEVTTDTINEETSDAGVTVDGLLIKDSSIPEAAVTEHEAALSITESQISDLGTYETADATIAKTGANETITGDWTFSGSTELTSPAIIDSLSLDSNQVTTTDVDCSTGNVFWKVLSANTTFTFSNAPSTGKGYEFKFILTQDSTLRTITWPASVDWDGGSAPSVPAAGNVMIITFLTIDGGTTWYGLPHGDDFI
jgi:hypothetical protein